MQTKPTTSHNLNFIVNYISTDRQLQKLSINTKGTLCGAAEQKL
jgi:hypothetical protein